MTETRSCRAMAYPSILLLDTHVLIWWDAGERLRGGEVAVWSMEYREDRSLSESQIRFVEMVVEQLCSRGRIDSGALYQAPFTSLHSGGPDALFAGKSQVIEGIFERIRQFDEGLGEAG